MNTGKQKAKYPMKEKFGKNVWIWTKKDQGHWERIGGKKQICDLCVKGGFKKCPCPHFLHFSELGKKSWEARQKKLLNK